MDEIEDDARIIDDSHNKVKGKRVNDSVIIRQGSGMMTFRQAYLRNKRALRSVKRRTHTI